MLISLAYDRQIDRFMRHHASRGFDALARDVDPFGRAEYIRPALAAAIVLPFVAGKRDLATSAVRVAISYFAADGVESLLKPVVGRHRPDSTEQSFRFHPFVNQDVWHSFPSAHATHAFALAEAIGEETDSPWIKRPAFAIATLVGAQRVYKQAHWTSDVVASAALSTIVSRAAEQFLHDRMR